jgi:glycerophosphoryl diester phosphodiesterase
MDEVGYFAGEHPIRLAHRGSRELWPENTWHAFDAVTKDLGYRYIETDIRVTRDGVVVVFHDDTLERTTNGVGRVSDWMWEDLKHLDAAYHFSPDGENHPLRSTGVHIHSLEETFERYPDVYFNIDLKAKGSAWLVADVIVRAGRTDSVMIGSFNDLRLSRFRRITKGEVATSAGPRSATAMYSASRVGRSLRRPHQAYQLPHAMRGVPVDRRLLESVHAAGAHLHLWTVNEPELMDRYIDLGVDGIVTDRPDLLNEVLGV